MVNRAVYAPTPIFPLELSKGVEAAADVVQESYESEHDRKAQEN